MAKADIETTTSKKATTATAQKSTKRRIKQSTYRSFRLSKRIKHQGPKLLAAPKLLWQSFGWLWRYKKVLGGVLLVYALLQLLLVQGVLGSDFSEVNELVRELSEGQWFGLAGGVTLLSYLAGTSGQAATAEAGVYQALLLLIASLAFIWAIRQLLAEKNIRIRDSFYQGMTPLVPFILVLLVIGLQLIPLLIGSWLYQTVVSAGIAVSFIEQLVWICIFGVLGVLSLYMVLSSIFALYIVTLPGMTPLRALRSARQLVLHRRLVIIVKLLFAAVSMLIIGALILLPIIMFVPVVAPWMFYILTVLAVGLAHSYLYGLYRELLHE